MRAMYGHVLSGEGVGVCVCVADGVTLGDGVCVIVDVGESPNETDDEGDGVTDGVDDGVGVAVADDVAVAVGGYVFGAKIVSTPMPLSPVTLSTPVPA